MVEAVFMVATSLFAFCGGIYIHGSSSLVLVAALSVGVVVTAFLNFGIVASLVVVKLNIQYWWP